MQLLGLEFSHTNVALDMRERLTFKPDALAEIYADWSKQAIPLENFVVLSTCNRVEVIGVFNSAESSLAATQHALLAQLAETKQIPATWLAEHAVWHVHAAAATHLCRVASGLESRLVGESQILGQIAKAFEFATQHGANGPLLKHLFQTAIRCGKRARTETELGRHAASVGSVAVKLAQKQVNSLVGKRVLLIGTGEIGQLVLQSLHGAGATDVTLMNRTPEHARTLADKYGARFVGLAALDDEVNSAEIVITATNAQTPIITAHTIQQRTDPLLLIDLSVPRNIDPTLAQLAGVTLLDIDQLGDVREENLSKRRQAIPQIEAIIAEELLKFEAVTKALVVEPTIGELHRHADDIRLHELSRLRRHLPNDLDPAIEAQIQLFSQSLVKKLLHQPTMQLREAAKADSAEPLQSSTRELFQL